MRKGDVVFFRASDTFISKLISKISSSEFTHVGLVISDTIDNNNVIIIEANRFIRTRKVEFTFDPSLHALYRIPNLTDKQRQDIVAYGLSMLGTRYDYLQIFGFLLRFVFKLNISIFNRANYIICSELIDKAYFTSGVKRNSNIGIGNCTPQELLQNYDFILVNS